jgi:hypothetical protein
MFRKILPKPHFYGFRHWNSLFIVRFTGSSSLGSASWLELIALAVVESWLRPFAWSVAASLPFHRHGFVSPVPVLSNRSRYWQLIQECLHDVARREKFLDPPHRETWLRLVAIYDTSHTELRKVFCPGPAPPQRLRNTAPTNKTLGGRSGLPSLPQQSIN